MPVSFDYFPMSGGLDVVTPYFNMPPGRMISCLNYEMLPKGGYRRISGYQLFDGSIAPEPVPGFGDIRGVAVLNSVVFAIRDQELNGGLFRATAGGWVEQDLGSSLDFKNGVADFVEGQSLTGEDSGATATIERVVFSGGTNGVGDSNGRLVLSGITGVFIDGENLLSTSGIHGQADGEVFANTLNLGGRWQFSVHNFFGQDGSQRLYGANEFGEAFEWDGITFAPIKVGISGRFPRYVLAHKEHLFLVYRSGSIITSAPGEPLLFDALLGAIEIGVGDSINEVQSLPGGVLCIGCDASVQMLYGNDYESWQLQQFTDHGLKAYSMGEIGGSILALDDRGVQNIIATQAYGDFSAISQSQAINPLLLKLRTDLQPSATMVSKTSSQYRLFFGKDGFYFTYIGSELSGITVVRYEHPVLMSAVGESELGKEILFFGSSDGMVFQADKGYKFNTTPILSHFTVAFNYLNMPTTRKQYRLAVLDVQTEGDSAQIFVKPDYDFSGAEVPIIPYSELLTATNNAGVWDVSEWDEFEWAAPKYTTVDIPLAAIARNMSLSFVSTGETDGSHTFFGVAIHYSKRRLDR